MKGAFSFIYHYDAPVSLFVYLIISLFSFLGTHGPYSHSYRFQWIIICRKRFPDNAFGIGSFVSWSIIVTIQIWTMAFPIPPSTSINCCTIARGGIMVSVNSRESKILMTTQTITSCTMKGPKSQSEFCLCWQKLMLDLESNIRKFWSFTYPIF